MYVRRHKRLGFLIVLAATMGLVLAIFGLEARANSSRNAQVRVDSLTRTLADLQTAPFNADVAAGGSANASRSEIKFDEATILRGLTAASQPGVQAALLAGGRADLTILEPEVASLYSLFEQVDAPDSTSAIPNGFDLEGLLIVRGALEQAFRAIGLVDAARAATAQTEAEVAIAGGMALLLMAFAFFYVRASRLGDDARRAAQANAIARDEAVEASNAKSMFIATVSHELRTPLTGVIGMSELLLDTPLDSDQHQYAHLSRSAAEGLLLVINDILDYSKIEAGKLELDPGTFSLRETVGEACAMLLVTSREKGVELVVDIDDDLPAWLHGDAARIRQVVLNLLSNAVKFTARGKVSVHVKTTPLSQAAHVRVEVRDTGIGIHEKTLARLFQPFTQADNSTARKFGGTGLGLAISAQLIEAMGGAIGASSMPRQGSTFWFELSLPLAEQDDQAKLLLAAHAMSSAPAPLTDTSPVVLVAEDNPINQIIAARALERIGYAAELVSDGREALAAINQTAYAAVLMDCQMPEMDGYEATRAIRRGETGPDHLPIIAMTASTMPGDREQCLAAGMDDYISKPIRAQLLADTLARNIATPSRSGVLTAARTDGSKRYA